MIPSGGPAALYGFLYQILRTAEWALRIDLQTPHLDLSDVKIVAEPREADIVIHFPHERVFQQFKVRDGGTWSLAEVVDEVLLGLYRNVADEAVKARYDFVTSGRMGRWAQAYDFFRSLSNRVVGSQPLDQLDASTEQFQMERRWYSERTLFAEIVRRLRDQKAPPADEAEAMTIRKLWHLLARFTFVQTANGDEAERDVRRLLASYVLDDESLSNKVALLLKTIIGYSTAGGRSFTPEELFRDAGIDGISFTKLPLVREAVAELTRRDMQRLVGYDRSLSVRPSYQWQGGQRILGFSGESGQGKSWALGDVAHDLLHTGEQGTFVVFVRATGDLQADLTEGMRRVIRDVLGYQNSASIDQMAMKVREILPAICNPWLTICLDDVRSAAEIVAFEEARLEHWGIRVAFTALPRYANHAVLARLEAAVEAIRDFTDDELREFLRGHDRDWSEIPPDVRRTMRRPFLAQIYVRETAAWAPRNEYEIYDACWRRLSTEREQPDHPADVAAILTLARDFRNGGVYPWSRIHLRKLGITGDEQIRLEAIGWLRPEPAGAARIWHDRLLNWAAAETVTDEIAEIRDDPAKIAALISPLLNEHAPRSSERPGLSYVPMDTLWIVATRRILTTDALAEVIRSLEASNIGEVRDLYRMLGTIGPVIVPALAHRLRMAKHNDEHGNESVAGSAILEALKADADAREHVTRLLNDDSVSVRNVGVRAASAYPARSHVQPLWDMLVEHDAGGVGDATSPGMAHLRRERIFNALASSIALDLAWLEQKILKIEAKDCHVKTLAWILASMTDNAGRDLWFRVKSTLFENTEPTRPGGLIACIARFRDLSEVGQLEKWLELDDDFASPSALGALAVLAPERALSFARAGDSATVAHFAYWWFPWLALTRLDDTLTAARERLRADSAVPEWFSGSEEHIDAKTVEALVAHLNEQLNAFLADPLPERPVFGRVVRLLKKAAHPVVIDSLARYGDQEIVQQLLTTARRLPLQRQQLFDEAGDVRVLLRRISQQASGAAVAAAIADGGEAPIRDIEWAAAYPTDEVRQALWSLISRSEANWDKKSIPYRVTRAVRSLAIIGDDAHVIDAVWMFGPNVLDDDLAWMTAALPPMSDDLVGRLVSALESRNSADDEARAIGALGISRRRDLLSKVLFHACREDASSEVRWHGLRAARDLLEHGDDVAEYVQSIVDGDHGRVRHVLAELLLVPQQNLWIVFGKGKSPSV